MSLSGIYENLPLKALRKAAGQTKTASGATENVVSAPTKLKTIQNIFYGVERTSSKKHNGHECALQTLPAQDTEGVAERVREVEVGVRSVEDAGQLVAGDGDGTKPSEVCGKATKGDEEVKSQQRMVNQHSTPTSTFDDGYESCNSTPQGSGKSTFDARLLLGISELDFMFFTCVVNCMFWNLSKVIILVIILILIPREFFSFRFNAEFGGQRPPTMRDNIHYNLKQHNWDKLETRFDLIGSSPFPWCCDVFP